MPTFGWLMIGNEIHVPDAPGLVIVNVPPWRSSTVSFLAPGPPRDVADRGRERVEAQAVGAVHDGDDEALVVEVDRDAEVDRLVHDERVAVDRGVDQWIGAQRVAHRARATNGRYVMRASARTASIAE